MCMPTYCSGLRLNLLSIKYLLILQCVSDNCICTYTIVIHAQTVFFEIHTCNLFNSMWQHVNHGLLWWIGVRGVWIVRSESFSIKMYENWQYRRKWNFWSPEVRNEGLQVGIMADNDWLLIISVLLLYMYMYIIIYPKDTLSLRYHTVRQWGLLDSQYLKVYDSFFI